MNSVFVTGGAGYVGSVLVPKLLDRGYRVKVLDLFLYGDDVLANHPHLELIRGDIRDTELLKTHVRGCDQLIHLACISNDPSFELNPDLGKSINYDAFEPLVRIARDHGVRRFIYASSSSVYGVKEEEQVTEDLPLQPLTDYSKYKAKCEEVLARYRRTGFETFVVRPATVCGYSPRLRLDLTVNILTNHAVHRGEITVFGGTQQRPNIHIEDMTDLYCRALEWPTEKVDGRTYNVGYQNQSVMEIALAVRDIVGKNIRITTTQTDDNRSYRISSDRIRKELGFEPRHSIEEAVRDLVAAFGAGKVPDAMENDRYYNIRTMKRCQL